MKFEFLFLQSTFAAFLLSAAPNAGASPNNPTSPQPAAAASSSAALKLQPPPPSIGTPRRILATAGSLFPGLLVHGTGHFIAQQPQTARRLLAIEGMGFGMMLAGVAGIAGLGATRRLIGPLIHTTIIGTGLFTVSALADLYGVIAPAQGTGSPFFKPPWFEAQLGFRYINNPVFRFRAFMVQGFDVRYRSLHLEQSAWFALDDQNTRFRALGGFRFFGPTPSSKTSPSSRAPDGSYFDIETAFTHHRYTSDGFAISTGELALSGRLDLRHIGPTLQGSFAEISVGAALEGNHYFALPDTESELLLGRFAFGIYLGHSGFPRGETMLYYDHRHDGFAAGFPSNNVGGGPLGHLGSLSRLYLNPHIGLLLDAQIGSALVLGMSLLIRPEGSP